MKILLIGPGYPLRGGLSQFDHRIVKEFVAQGYDCEIVSFSLQYPSFLFPGKTQFYTEPQSDKVRVRSLINSVNPLNWWKVGNQLRKEQPDIVIVRYWLPFMGPALGTIARRIKKNKTTKVICLCDNAIPHEKRPGDVAFTKYFLRPMEAFVAMSEKVKNDLRQFVTEKQPIQLIHHPLYDNFGEKMDQQEARKFLNLPENEDLFLFFGFIRKYKGLDLLFDALKIYKSKAKRPFKLLVCGEFYEDEKPYLEQLERLQLKDDVLLFTKFIPDSEVKYYLSAADLLIQPYRNATQSGVTLIAYQFETPIVVTKVGGLEKQVKDQITGFVVEPEANAIAQAMENYTQRDKASFEKAIQEEKQHYSWKKFIETFLELGK